MVKENTFRRDKCQCPKCSAFIYLCRTPGCHDFAKGTKDYDHEFFLECTVSLNDAGREIGKVAVHAAKVLPPLIVNGLIAAADIKHESSKS